MTLVQLSDRGRVTLPVEVRKSLGLRGGDAYNPPPMTGVVLCAMHAV
jgi:hypothetical protein